MGKFLSLQCAFLSLKGQVCERSRRLTSVPGNRRGIPAAFKSKLQGHNLHRFGVKSEKNSQLETVMRLAVFFVAFMGIANGATSCLEQRSRVIRLKPKEKTVLSCCHYRSMNDAKWRIASSANRSLKVPSCRKIGKTVSPACVEYRSSLMVDLHITAEQSTTFLCGREAYWNRKFSLLAKVEIIVTDGEFLDNDTTSFHSTPSPKKHLEIIKSSDVSNVSVNNNKGVHIKIFRGFCKLNETSSDDLIVHCKSNSSNSNEWLVWKKRKSGKLVPECQDSSTACFRANPTDHSLLDLKIPTTVSRKTKKTRRFVCKEAGGITEICQISVLLN
eukprot:m.153007 g.153007  ORF g.153007 m.153007 type:complete len:330 (+) comp38613_c0_seq10:736-1725(+)